MATQPPIESSRQRSWSDFSRSGRSPGCRFALDSATTSSASHFRRNAPNVASAIGYSSFRNSSSLHPTCFRIFLSRLRFRSPGCMGTDWQFRGHCCRVGHLGLRCCRTSRVIVDRALVRSTFGHWLGDGVTHEGLAAMQLLSTALKKRLAGVFGDGVGCVRFICTLRAWPFVAGYPWDSLDCLERGGRLCGFQVSATRSGERLPALHARYARRKPPPLEFCARPQRSAVPSVRDPGNQRSERDSDRLAQATVGESPDNRQRARRFCMCCAALVSQSYHWRGAGGRRCHWRVHRVRRVADAHGSGPSRDTQRGQRHR